MPERELRIIDANLNRVAEGLRVLEDVARLALDDAALRHLRLMQMDGRGAILDQISVTPLYHLLYHRLASRIVRDDTRAVIRIRAHHSNPHARAHESSYARSPHCRSSGPELSEWL